jgi:hypothetical protein
MNHHLTINHIEQQTAEHLETTGKKRLRYSDKKGQQINLIEKSESNIEGYLEGQCRQQ